MIEPITSEAAPEPQDQQQAQDGLQAHFQPHISADEIEQVYHLKRAQPLLQVFTALFHGGFDGVLVRLLVLRELASDTASTSFTRADINTRLAYLLPESLETVLMRLRSNQLLAWDAQQAVYRVTPMARNVLSAIDALLAWARKKTTTPKWASCCRRWPAPR
jgi:DNA-binding HxlR family transcriptional regulator